MSVSRLRCRAQLGLESIPVEVEVHLASGLPQFNIVGLAATEVKESRERVRSALGHCGYVLPPGRITVNLAPADLPKDGGRFDLAIALGILLAAGQLPAGPDQDHEFVGELGLAGEVRAVRGVLPTAIAVQRAGRCLLAPHDNAAELGLLPPETILVVQSLMDVCAWWRNERELPTALQARNVSATPRSSVLLKAQRLWLDDVQGQAIGKRALQVAAAGEHSLLYVGPPGCGKSMLARRLPGILPPMTDAERLQIAMMNSLLSPALAASAGGDGIQRPFRAPHNSASANAIIGGGNRLMPGEISLAHGGVLFLDELPEFDRRVLEALREPLDTGTVALARVGLRAEYPARFQLVAAMNPCPCGYAGTSRECRCSMQDITRYRARLSGPLLDRIDLRVTLQPVTENAAEGSVADSVTESRQAEICEQVAAARALQVGRQGAANASLVAKEIESMGISLKARAALQRIAAKRALSLRAQHRVLRVSRTLADMQSPLLTQPIELWHISEALQLRQALENE